MSNATVIVGGNVQMDTHHQQSVTCKGAGDGLHTLPLTCSNLGIASNHKRIKDFRLDDVRDSRWRIDMAGDLMLVAPEVTWTRKEKIIVHTMRCLDQGAPKRRDEIDRVVAQEKYDDGSRRLIRRAKLVLRAECGTDSVDECGNTMLVTTLVVVLTVVVLLIYFVGLPGTPLKVINGNEVSVFWLIWFAVLQIVSFAFSAVMLTAGVISSQFAKQRGDNSLFWQWWRRLQPLGWIQWATRQVALAVGEVKQQFLISRSDTKRSLDGESTTDRPIPVVDLPYDDLMVFQAKWLSVMISLMTQCLWTLTATAISVTILVTLLSNQYRFTWRDSLLSAEWKHRVVTSLGGPLSGLVQIPDQNDILWVLVERADSHNPQLDTSSDIEKLAEHDQRARWGWFLLAIVFVYAVPPRILLLCICLYLKCRADREMIPNLDDVYFHETLKFCDPNIIYVTTEVQPTLVSNAVTNPTNLAAANLAEPNLTPSKVRLVRLPDVSLPVDCGPDLVVLSYEVFPSENLLKVLPIPIDCYAENFGDVDGAIQRKKVLDRLVQVITTKTKAVLVVSADGTADAAFSAFFASLRQLVSSTPGLLVLLTHLERMRENLHSDVEQIQARLKYWHRA